MTQKYRTTCFADALVDYPGSLEDDPDWREEVVGFRLTRDNVGRVLRGGSWLYGPQSARVADRSYDVPGSRFDDLGIRLCVDWSEE